MPVITVQMKRISADKKKELIAKLTATATEVTNTPASSYTVFIEEYEADSIGIGGQSLSEKLAKQ